MDNGYRSIPQGNENALTQAVATIGPIAVALDANGLQHYKGDIYPGRDCNPRNINHGVLFVGYGTNQNGQAYYLVKNSWGTRWGHNGYFKIARNRGNLCGILNQASYPIV